MKLSDSQRLWAAIVAMTSRRTVSTAQLYDAYTQAFPDRIGHGTVDRDLAAALQALAAAGRIRPSLRLAPGTNPPLPRRITRFDIATTPRRADPADWYGLRWHPDLAGCRRLSQGGDPDPPRGPC